MALHKANPHLHVNIEHEDASFGQIEGIEYAAKNLIEAGERSGVVARA